MQSQNFKNHSRFVPLYHYVIFALLLAILVGSIVNLCKSSCGDFYSASLITALTIVVILVTYFARSFALKAQDRAIRAEENFRHYVLTGKTLPTALKISQIIALRFASDAEWLSLMQKAIDEKLSAKQIKESITSHAILTSSSL